MAFYSFTIVVTFQTASVICAALSAMLCSSHCKSLLALKFWIFFFIWFPQAPDRPAGYSWLNSDARLLLQLLALLAMKACVLLCHGKLSLTLGQATLVCWASGVNSRDHYRKIWLCFIVHILAKVLITFQDLKESCTSAMLYTCRVGRDL